MIGKFLNQASFNQSSLQRRNNSTIPIFKQYQQCRSCICRKCNNPTDTIRQSCFDIPSSLPAESRCSRTLIKIAQQSSKLIMNKHQNSNSIYRDDLKGCCTSLLARSKCVKRTMVAPTYIYAVGGFWDSPRILG